MRQLTCIGPRQIEWRDVPEPKIEGVHEALVRPIAVARCEIDPALIAGAQPGVEPFALGHECVAEIIDLGDSVQGLEVGQKVVVAFQLSCGQCGSCSAGHSGNCDDYPVLSDYGMRPLSGVEYGGALSDLVRVPHAEAMLQAISPGLDPISLASVSDNVLDGFRAVAPHVSAHPGAEVLIVNHGIPSIALYAVQAALALGASRVDFASDSSASLALAERLGAHPVETDFERRQGRYPIVADCGTRDEGLHYSLGSTAPEGICQSVSFLAAPMTPIALGKLYTLGIQFFIGRTHAASLLPTVMSMIEAGQLRPGEITTRVVDWEQAPEAFLDDTIKLVIARN